MSGRGGTTECCARSQRANSASSSSRAWTRAYSAGVNPAPCLVTVSTPPSGSRSRMVVPSGPSVGSPVASHRTSHSPSSVRVERARSMPSLKSWVTIVRIRVGMSTRSCVSAADTQTSQPPPTTTAAATSSAGSRASTRNSSSTPSGTGCTCTDRMFTARLALLARGLRGGPACAVADPVVHHREHHEDGRHRGEHDRAAGDVRERVGEQVRRGDGEEQGGELDQLTRPGTRSSTHEPQLRGGPLPRDSVAVTVP